MTTALPEVLDVAAVMELYRLRDRRSARKVMDAAGAFEVGGRLLVRREDLLAHEEALRQRRRLGSVPEPTSPRPRPRRRGARAPASSRPRGPLGADWWRDPPEGEAA